MFAWPRSWTTRARTSAGSSASRERQLRSWEREGLIPAAATYSFSDLIAIQTLVKLRESHIPPRQIGRAMASLRQKLEGVKQPLAELRIVSNGRKIAVQVAGQKMEALTGQILFDFDASGLGGVTSFPERKPSATLLREAEAWFQRGLALEETGAPAEQAIEAYEKALELNPEAAGVLVNLGTIYYRLRRFPEAEKRYLEAIAADRRLSAGGIQPGQPVRRTGPPGRGPGTLSPRAGSQPQLCRRAFQRGAAVRAERRKPEGGASLEELPEAGQLRPVGGHRAPPTGKAPAVGDRLARLCPGLRR